MLLLLFLLPLLPFALLLFGMLIWYVAWPILLVIFIIWLVAKVARG
jgi:hypothetical protein